MNKEKMRRVIIEAVAAAVLIFLLVFFVGFKVTEIQVVGNKFYSDEEIKKMVLDAPIAGNSVLAMLTKTEEKTKDAKMIERVTLKRRNRNTIVVQVKEKQIIGYFEFEGKYINFDRQGIIQIFTEKPMKGVPLIEGFKVKEAKQGEKLKGINTKKLNTILSVGKMLEKTPQKPDKLFFNHMSQLVLYYAKVEVRLGSDENMDEKMNRLEGILPQLEGMEGILHLENITEDTQTVVFDNMAEPEKDSGEEEGADTEDTGEQEAAEEGIEDVERQDTAEEEDTEGSDAEEDRKENSDLEYSDGSDAADNRETSEE